MSQGQRQFEPRSEPRSCCCSQLAVATPPAAHPAGPAPAGGRADLVERPRPRRAAELRRRTRPSGDGAGRPRAGRPRRSRLVHPSITCNDVCGPRPGTTILSDGRVDLAGRGARWLGHVEGTHAPTPAGACGSSAMRWRPHGPARDRRLLRTARPSGWAWIRPSRDHQSRSSRGLDDHIVKVSTVDPGTFETDNKVLGDVGHPCPDLRALRPRQQAVGSRAWLPADAWAMRSAHTMPIVATIVVTAERSGELPPLRGTQTPCTGHCHRPSDTIGQPFTEQGTPVANSRCLSISRELRSRIGCRRACGRTRTIPRRTVYRLFYAWKRGPGSVDGAAATLPGSASSTCDGWRRLVAAGPARHCTLRLSGGDRLP